MNKRHIEQVKKRNREEAQQVQTFNGLVAGISFCNRKINRARRAVFDFNFIRSVDGKSFKLLVPISLRKRCINEITAEAILAVTVQAMSPDGGYRRADNEFELKDFIVLNKAS